jgi:hypothetical protein
MELISGKYQANPEAYSLVMEPMLFYESLEVFICSVT